MSWHVGLPYERPPLSLNDRTHWADAARWRKQIKGDVMTLARAHHLPRDLERVHVELHWQPKMARRRDTDNPAPTLKACIDGLVMYRLIRDDDYTHLTSEVVIHPPDNNNPETPRLWLIVAELQRHAPEGGAA